MSYHPESLIRDISAKAYQFRIEVLKMVYENQTGHIGGGFSAAEIVASLYFHHLKIDPARPDWPERDRFLFSKGHACAILYSALAYRGFFPPAELPTFRKLDSRLQGHPDPHKTPGVEIPAGPLGHGVAVGVGMALALQGGGKPASNSAPSARASAAKVYTLLGDGEINAGVIWEGALAAVKYRCGNLTATTSAKSWAPSTAPMKSTPAPASSSPAPPRARASASSSTITAGTARRRTRISMKRRWRN